MKKSALIFGSCFILLGAVLSPLAHADAPVMDANQYQSVDQNDSPEAIANSSQSPAYPDQYQPDDQTQGQDPEPAQLSQGPAPETAQPIANQAPDNSSLSTSQRITKLEQQMNNVNQMNLLSQIQSLQQEVQNLRGQLEVQTHDLSNLKTQQSTMYQDLDTRMAKANTGASANKPNANIDVNNGAQNDKDNSTVPATDKTMNDHKGSVNAGVTDIDDTTNAVKNDDSKLGAQDKSNSDIAKSGGFLQEQDSYTKAYDLIRKKDYPNAISALKNYLQKFPQGQYAANAHYWLGELYYIQHNTDKASQEFALVIKNYPQDKKVPDAKLKLGLIYFDNGQMNKAKEYLTEVTKKYPGTSVAQLAKSRLEQIKQVNN